MRIAVIAVSRAGLEKARILLKELSCADIYLPARFFESGAEVSLPGETNGQGPASNHSATSCSGEESAGGTLLPLEGGFCKAVGEIFKNYEALIFISAVAVAVRGIAPYLAGKDEDPAVVAVDEGGRFAISLLSGHLGGANELTGKVARVLGALEVVTTATDGRGLPAFDDLARRWGWKLENLPALKNISAALLEGREIMLYSEQEFCLPLEGNINIKENPGDLERAQHGAVIVSNRLQSLALPEAVPYIVMRPKNIAAGVGCRRGVAAEDIIRSVKEAFSRAGLSDAGLCCLASGEFKADEEGLIDAAKSLGVPLKIYTREEIKPVIGDSATSKFVENEVGVGAVAEPCAVLGSGYGKIVLPVQKGGGITIALAEGDLFCCTG